MTQKNYNDAIVWLPTYNEELNIVKMIIDIRSLDFAVCVTDGGSSDRTVALAQSMGVEVLMRPGKHKGYGIQHALKESKKRGYNKFIYIDCDQTYPVEKLPELYTLGQINDMAVAARDFSRIVLPNRMANYLFTGLINLLFGSRLHDTQSGMRILDIDTFTGHIRSEQFDLETEFSCFALKNKLKIAELPVEYYDRIGESKATVYQALLILRRIFICRFIDKGNDS